MKLSRVKGNENGRYLVCANYVRGHRCADGNRHFRYEPLEAVILDHVREINLAETLQAARFDDARRKLDETIAELTLQLEELRRKEQRLAQAIEDDNEPPNAILNLLRARQSERQAVEAELRHQQTERQRQSIRHDNSANMADRIAKLRVAWENAEEATRYELRSEAHTAIRELMTEISFDSPSYTAVVIIENGVSAYRIKDRMISALFRAFAA